MRKHIYWNQVTLYLDKLKEEFEDQIRYSPNREMIINERLSYYEKLFFQEKLVEYYEKKYYPDKYSYKVKAIEIAGNVWKDEELRKIQKIYKQIVYGNRAYSLIPPEGCQAMFYNGNEHQLWIDVEAYAQFYNWLKYKRNDFIKVFAIPLSNEAFIKEDPFKITRNIKSKFLLLENNTAHIREILKPLSGFYKGKKVMTKENYEALFTSVLFMIENEDIPSEFCTIEKVNVPIKFVGKIFHTLHGVLYGRKKRQYWFQFLQRSFAQYAKWDLEVISSAISTYADYDKILAEIHYED